MENNIEKKEEKKSFFKNWLAILKSTWDIFSRVNGMWHIIFSNQIRDRYGDH